MLAGAGQAAPAPAPANFNVACTTTNGAFTIAVHRAWAPHGADRFYTLVEGGYYTGNAFFRVLPGFVVQWGLNPDPALSRVWSKRPIPDDPVRESNLRGRISFASRGRNTRSTQVFVNLGNNQRLDRLGFAPFGEVTAGLDAVAHMAADYGEMAPAGQGPDPRMILQSGAAYLTRNFPRLDVIYSCKVVQ